MSGCGPPPKQEYVDWPNRPAYLCAHPKVHTMEYEVSDALPLGIPIEFESELFKGKIFIRLRPIESHAESKADHSAYFDGNKKFWQCTVQGQFKEQLNMSDIMVGDFYDKPMNMPRGIVGGSFMKAYQKAMEILYPGLVMDFISDEPKLLAPFGGVQIMRIDLPENQPNITSVIGGLQEDTSLLLGEKFSTSCSAQKRKKYLSRPKDSSKYTVNPDHVYTFEMYDHSMCFGSYYQHIMGTKIDLVKSMNAQPLAFGLHTRDSSVIYKFLVWHERLIEEMNK